MYISYFGIRAAAVMDRLGIDRYHFVYEGFENLREPWEAGISLGAEVIDLISESVLLQTLSQIGSRRSAGGKDRQAAGNDRFLQIKKYVDDCFSDPELSLEALSELFSYNKKYISQMFGKYLQVGLTEYVNTLRINHACVLIDQGYTGVGDIARLCGFNDPMYFSKVFRRKMGKSPKAHISDRKLMQ